ncbi:MAG: cell division protein FtsW [Candidatus Latescibacterota bacterium]|nr:MAG: cell division protein FtsW [Candidatus Latescibacterota bacterium]
MRLRHDHAILILVLALLVVGIGILYSASYELARAASGDGLRFVKRQLVNATVGLAALLLVSQIDYRRWRRAARLLLLFAALALCVVFLFDAVRGARNWVPFFGRTLQPVEFLRVALLLFLASEIVERGERLRSLRGLLPLFGVVAALVLLVLKQNDFGSAMALCLISFTLLFVGGARWRHLVAAAFLLLLGAMFFALERPHVQERMRGFLHPQEHARSAAYQSLQSELSIGSGGMLGRGLGQGISKFGYIPDPHTDFIFAVMGEELGFVGCIVVLLLFLMLIARAIRVARAQEDPFAQLIAVGVGVAIFWYVVINVMVATRLFPVTGLPLPFVSYGGSSLVSHLVALGVLRNVARQAEQTPRRARRWPARREHLLEGAL